MKFKLNVPFDLSPPKPPPNPKLLYHAKYIDK